MNVGSLFSGIGGIEYGFEAEGFRTEWFVERDPYAQAVLRKHWSQALIYDDVTTIDWATVPKIDILTGGFPCQDISNAGKRIGITGSRSSLWKHYCEAIRVLRPKYALIENVAALTSRGLDVVLADLAEIGYDAEWYNLSASAVGALHRRERIFILAYANSPRLQETRSEQQSAGSCRCSLQDANVSNSECVGYEERRTKSGELRNGSSHDEFDNCRKVLPSIRRENTNGFWAIEPDVGRVAHGVSNRVDRIKCLGNAVVPQCAQIFAQAIKEREAMK